MSETTDQFGLWIPGKPAAKGRPRATRQGRVYTPQETVSAEQAVQTEWIAAGRPRLPDGPISLFVAARFARPAGHWRTDGSLSAAGGRSHAPTKRPDCDNIGKLIADALNGRAWSDDAQIVALIVQKSWCARRAPEGVSVEAVAACVPEWRRAA